MIEWMDCPICGFANPPEALACDCGYDFRSGKRNLPAWEINLAWRQKLAAYWSISWPGLLVSYINIILVTALIPFDSLKDSVPTIIIANAVIFFGLQAILVPRLVWKNYRTFRIVVVRENGQETRGLTMGEVLRVWLWIFAPQLALLLIVLMIAVWYGNKLPATTLQAIDTLSRWLLFLVVGPYSIASALRAKYPGFRLIAHGFRYV